MQNGLMRALGAGSDACNTRVTRTRTRLAIGKCNGREIVNMTICMTWNATVLCSHYQDGMCALGAGSRRMRVTRVSRTHWLARAIGNAQSSLLCSLFTAGSTASLRSAL